MKNLIVDLDGTIALERHRRPLSREGWAEYFKHIHLDPVNESVLKFLEMAFEEHNILIFTSRPSIYAPQTFEWLEANNVPYHRMEMRSEADTETGDGDWQAKKSDYDVKLEMLVKHRIGPANTFCVLEDRDDMVEFYRALGYDCWQVHPQHEMYRPDVTAHEGVQNV